MEAANRGNVYLVLPGAQRLQRVAGLRLSRGLSSKRFAEEKSHIEVQNLSGA